MLQTNAPHAMRIMSAGVVVGTFPLKINGDAKSVDTDTVMND